MRITLNMPIGYTTAMLTAEAKHVFGERDFFILKRAIDARRKGNIHYVITLTDELPEMLLLPEKMNSSSRPVVVGGGPCGLFAAYWLSLAGLRPILIERGADISERESYVAALMERRILNEESNIAFGIGGAGAFSDGKLNTGTNSPYHHFILKTMVACGAPEEIAYESQPHIGSDKLPIMLSALTALIIKLGGEIKCHTKLAKIHTNNNQIIGIDVLSFGEEQYIETDTVLLAIGHSARETFTYLHNDLSLAMEQKNFAVGLRIEHLQENINFAQFGTQKGLPSANYKLTAHGFADVYTFCMCPGGMVVPSMHEKNTVVTNGMSNYARNGKNANSAVITPVGRKDFYDSSPLAGMYFQQSIEQKAFIMAGKNYNAPISGLSAFLGKGNKPHIEPTYRPGVTTSPLHELYPSHITEALRFGICEMEKKLHGFMAEDAVLTGPETRTSSPIRILRDETGQGSVSGLFPAGEGSGFAGGILSAAADGIRQAEKIIDKIKNIKLGR